MWLMKRNVNVCNGRNRNVKRYMVHNYSTKACLHNAESMGVSLVKISYTSPKISKKNLKNIEEIPKSYQIKNRKNFEN